MQARGRHGAERRAAGRAQRVLQGRSYVEHVAALGRDPAIPERVRDASKHLLDARPPSSDILTLRSRRSDERLLEAARDVMAHAYAVVKRHESEDE